MTLGRSVTRNPVEKTIRSFAHPVDDTVGELARPVESCPVVHQITVVQLSSCGHLGTPQGHSFGP